MRSQRYGVPSDPEHEAEGYGDDRRAKKHRADVDHGVGCGGIAGDAEKASDDKQRRSAEHHQNGDEEHLFG